MNRYLPACAVVLSLAFAGCGGGGSSYGGGGSNPAPIPTLAPDANIPQQATVKSSAAWVTSPASMTLYTFDLDTAGVSNCPSTNGCTGNWPPLMAAAGAFAQGNFTLITRTNPSGQQWAYQGSPVYAFFNDTAAGQANGDGVNAFGAVWHVARPAGVAGGGGTGGGGGCTGSVYC
jgi:predicted lipoprotein with Yx(FWY)xxD motif